jgi:RNA polymerase sigma factor (sigma-70 family)
VYKWVNKYRRPHIDEDDLFQEGMLGLIQAKENYEPGRAHFMTYAGQYVWKRTRHWTLNSQSVRLPTNQVQKPGFKPVMDGRIEDMYSLTAEPVDVMAKIEAGEILDLLNDQERLIVSRRLQDYTFEEIASEAGVSKQGAKYIYDKTIERLREALAGSDEEGTGGRRVLERKRRRPLSRHRVLRS